MIRQPTNIIVIILIFKFFLSASVLFCQTEAEENLLEHHHHEGSELIERLQSVRQNPFNLNRISLRKVMSLPFLTPFQARRIILERSQNGPFRSWSDLKKRLYFNDNLIRTIRPYFAISLSDIKTQDFIQFRSRFQQKLVKTWGFVNNNFLGSPYKVYHRILFNPNQNIKGGLLLEKDPGERRWDDHLVGFLESRIPRFKTRLLIGNFRTEFGQGLVLWGPYGFFKGADPVAPVKKRSQDILGYVYSDEIDYLTGIAAETNFRTFRITFLISSRNLDATLNSDGTARHIRTTGLHRTASEVASQDCLKETLLGGRVEHFWSDGVIGATGWWGRYSPPIRQDDLERYRFDFQGEYNSVVGIDYDLYFGRINFFGEIAQSQSRGIALIGSGILDIYRGFFLIVSYRRFDPQFQNPHSHSFGSDRVSNENGIYIGFKGRLTKMTHLSFYYDIFRKPWRTFTTPVPTSGEDLFFQVEQKCSPALLLKIRARFQHREVMEQSSSDPGLVINYLRDQYSYRYRLEVQYQPSPRIRLRSRWESVNVHYPPIRADIAVPFVQESGFLIYQDFWFRPFSNMTILARWISFDTDSYGSRIYEFEGDLPGVMNIRPLYGKGHRWYTLIRWQPFQNFNLGCKFSTTYHHGVTSWSSGYDRFEGNTEEKISVQVDIVL